ncbi:hypothetical protein AX17_001458 [Amanita inopinata Kibby_2008]|nr:hypothetical protein AX17_001458 [Amanita inopinata Kibby_2008]
MESSTPFFSSSRVPENAPSSPQLSSSGASTPLIAATVPLPMSPTLWSDNASSSSLPPTSQIPYHTLPRANAHGKGRIAHFIADEEEIGPRASPSPAPSEEASRMSSSESSNPPESHSSQKSHREIGPPPLEACTSSSSGSSSSMESIASVSSLSHNPSAKNPITPSYSSDFSHRLSSTFSSYSSNGLGSAYARPIPPPPSPPRQYIPRYSDIPPLSRFGSSRPVTSSSTSSSSSYYLEPPEPPMILPPDPYVPQSDTASQNDGTSGTGVQQAPHVPFLSHAPPPADSYIEVETTLREYRLLVKLPGFCRDSITLASKRRRILHIVADRWEGEGGHFERRISFGYDADLVQVRAEFDGEMLRVVVPRRSLSSAFSPWYG